MAKTDPAAEPLRTGPPRGAVVWALLSGPLLATVLLFLPFGLLTLALALADPRLAIFRSVPAGVFFSPWIALAALISVANLRLVVLEAQDPWSDGLLRVSTDRFSGDPSGAETVNGTPGRWFAEEVWAFIARQEGTAVTLGDPIGEDYGWGFWIGSRNRAPIWIAFSYVGPLEEGSPVEETVLSVSLEAPLLPWKRLAYKPDRALRNRLQKHLKAFCMANGISFTEESQA